MRQECQPTSRIHPRLDGLGLGERGRALGAKQLAPPDWADAGLARVPCMTAVASAQACDNHRAFPQRVRSGISRAYGCGRGRAAMLEEKTQDLMVNMQAVLPLIVTNALNDQMRRIVTRAAFVQGYMMQASLAIVGSSGSSPISAR
jgi:hypothetical protein